MSRKGKDVVEIPRTLLHRLTDTLCYDKNAGNPGDGSARTSGDCSLRVVRGGSWVDVPLDLRAAYRFGLTSVFRDYSSGFRLARTLAP